MRGNVLWVQPALPPELPRAAFEIVNRSQPSHVELTRERVSLASRPRSGRPVTVCVEAQISVLSSGELHVVALTPEGGPPLSRTSGPP